MRDLVLHHQNSKQRDQHYPFINGDVAIEKPSIGLYYKFLRRIYVDWYYEFIKTMDCSVAPWPLSDAQLQE